MSITMTKLMFAVPMAFFALKLNVCYIIGQIEKDLDILQKGIRSILCFFMTSYATMFYRGKGEFTAFTLNTKGVVFTHHANYADCTRFCIHVDS